MSNKLHRFIFENIRVRGEWVQLQSVWQEILQNAEYPDPVQKVLGEALAAISLMTESFKFNGSVVLQIRGTFPVTMLVVQATTEGNLRGIARWSGDIPENAGFRDLFGKGTLVISVEPNDGRDRYQSLVAIEGDSLAECLSSYFAQSEQLKTRFWLSADEKSVAGFMLQSLPEDQKIRAVSCVENDLVLDQDGWQHATIMADTLTQEELLKLDVTSLLHRLYHEDDIRLFDAQSLNFKCGCSQQKVENTIRSLGKIEARDILREQGSIRIQCEFCNQKYQLDSVDVKRLFAVASSTSAGDEPDTIH